VNLAPVLDVYRTAGNFDDQFQRSYSMNPQTAAGLGADFITAQQATGVAAAAKHFPGLGTASGFNGKRKDRETFYSFTSFTTPATGNGVLKDGQFVFSYYPDQHWLTRSALLKCPAAHIAQRVGARRDGSA